MAISSDVKLSIYNEALRALGSRKLASLTENREPRRVLDDVWNNAEVVERALERGDWGFAHRTAESANDSGQESGFGFTFVHVLPNDWARLSGIATDPYFEMPLTSKGYAIEAGRILSDHSSLYLRYVSNGDLYGMNSGLWSGDFREYVALYMAEKACTRLTGDKSLKEDIKRDMEKALAGAKSLDAMDDGVKFPPRGGWVRARWGGQSRDRDRWDGTTR